MKSYDIGRSPTELYAVVELLREEQRRLRRLPPEERADQAIRPTAEAAIAEAIAILRSRALPAAQ